MKRSPQPEGPLEKAVNSEDGSFLIAAALFMIMFLAVASLGIDGARYYMKTSRLQQIADGAALKGAQAFNSFDTRPERSAVNQAVLNYIENEQGLENRDLYEVQSPGKVKNIMIREVSSPRPNPNCTQGFALRNNQIVLTQPSRLETEVLGSAITAGAGGPPVPVTSRINVTNRGGTTTSQDPWGNYNNPNAGNVNTGGSIPPAQIQTQQAGSTVSLRAQSWYGGSPLIQAQTGGSQVTTLSNGDNPPSGSGFADQDDQLSFVQQYVNSSTGNIDIQQNQAILFFELGTTDSTSDAYDSQDLVLLVSVNPTSNGGNTGSGRRSYININSSGSQSSPCSPYPRGTYRVGVLTFENFTPYFLPEAIFGNQNNAIIKKAVAEVQPQNIVETKTLEMNCGVFANDDVAITGNNVNGKNANICSNSDILAANSANGELGDLYVHENSIIQPPGGEYGATEKFPTPMQNPTFNQTDPNNYDVNLSDFSLWTDQGFCNNAGGPSSTTKAMRTETAGTDFVRWENGDRVCVTYNSSLNRYTISNNNGGKMQAPDGSSITIYADGAVTINGNGTGLKGGLYAEGDINVNNNNHELVGDPSNLGGLAFWSEGSVNFAQNNVTIEGITGSEGNYTFSSSGGGTGPSLRGILISHGKFTLTSNSQNATLVHDTDKYDDSSLDNINQQQFSQSTADRPLYSNIRVKLIN